MKVFSVWKLKEAHNLKEINKYIQDNMSFTINCTEVDECVKLETQVTIDNNMESSISDIALIDGNNIEYIFFNLMTQRPKKSNLHYPDGSLKPNDERVNQLNVSILIFECNLGLYFVVSCGFSSAQTILNNYFGTSFGKFEKQNFDICEDLLYWIFKHYIDTDKRPLSESKNIYISALKSYAGKTKDNTNMFRGDGERIATILGTLAFLFNNDNLKAIRPEVQYNGHALLIELSLTGTFKLWEESYQGNLSEENVLKLTNKVIIYSIITLIPGIVECYKENLRKKNWSLALKKDFITRLGTEINRRVEHELANLDIQVTEENEQLSVEGYMEEIDLDEEIDLIDLDEEE